MIPRFDPPFSATDVLLSLTPYGGDPLVRFEETFAKAVGHRYAVAFPYGRTALLALLRALDLTGRDVLCPAYTCVVVPNAIIASGNRPIFVDSQADANADLSLAAVRAGASANAGALIATSIFGHPVDLGGLEAFRRSNPNLTVIQDCAHSFLCEWQGRPVHLEGDAAFFGLNVSKTMSSVFGGMASCDDARLAARLRDVRAGMLSRPGLGKMLARAAYAAAVLVAFQPAVFGLTNRLRSAGLLDHFTRYYDGERIDMPVDHLVGLTGFEARVGMRCATALPGLIASRRAYDNYYREALGGDVRLAWVERSAGSSVSHCVARVARKGQVRTTAARLGVELGEVIEYSVPDLPVYRARLSPHEAFPVAGAFAESTINLPTSTRFERAKAERVVRVVREALEGEPPVPQLPQPIQVMPGLSSG